MRGRLGRSLQIKERMREREQSRREGLALVNSSKFKESKTEA